MKGQPLVNWCSIQFVTFGGHDANNVPRKNVTGFCSNCQETIAMTQTAVNQVWHLMTVVLASLAFGVITGVMLVFVWLYTAAYWNSPSVCPKCGEPDVESKKEIWEKRLRWVSLGIMLFGLVITWSIFPAAASDDLREEIENEIVECRRASEVFNGRVPGPYSMEMKLIIRALKASADFHEVVNSVMEMVHDMSGSERREAYEVLFPNCAAVRAEVGL